MSGAIGAKGAKYAVRQPLRTSSSCEKMRCTCTNPQVYDGNQEPWRKLDVEEMRARLKRGYKCVTIWHPPTSVLPPPPPPLPLPRDPDLATVDLGLVGEMYGRTDKPIAATPLIGFGCDSEFHNPCTRGDWPGCSGSTLLHRAAASGHIRCVTKLMESGCESTLNDLGESPLDLALAKARSEGDVGAEKCVLQVRM